MDRASNISSHCPCCPSTPSPLLAILFTISGVHWTISRSSSFSPGGTLHHRDGISRLENPPAKEIRRWEGAAAVKRLARLQAHIQLAGAQVGGRNYPISHRAGAGEESLPVHIEGRNVSLDERQPGRRLSPQALVQEYLNVTDDHLWGAVTNGLRLRLLRDTSRTLRPSYLEFDLESIVEGITLTSSSSSTAYAIGRACQDQRGQHLLLAGKVLPGRCRAGRPGPQQSCATALKRL